MESRAASSLYVATAFTAYNGHNKFEVVGNAAAAAVCGRSILIINSRYYNKDICYAQCGNFKNFVSLTFYVKSILWTLEVQKLSFLPF